MNDSILLHKYFVVNLKGSNRDSVTSLVYYPLSPTASACARVVAAQIKIYLSPPNLVPHKKKKKNSK